MNTASLIGPPTFTFRNDLIGTPPPRLKRHEFPVEKSLDFAEKSARLLFRPKYTTCSLAAQQKHPILLIWRLENALPQALRGYSLSGAWIEPLCL